MLIATFRRPLAGYHRLARVAKLVNAAPLKGATALRFAGSALTELEPSGALGAENDGVYGEWLGLSGSEIEALRDEGII